MPTRLTVRRSWSQPVPKDDEPRRLVVVSELRPYLEDAMGASDGKLLFPREDGKPWDPRTRFRLVDQLRRALCTIGDVVGYDHSCRRCKAKAARGGATAPAETTWRYRDAVQRRCPSCGMKLWITPIPRPVRFYDLRPTHATLLRKARVDLGTVQKALGHSSPEITAGTYDHSELEDERETLERVLVRRRDARGGAPRGWGAYGARNRTWKNEARSPVGFPSGAAGFWYRGDRI
jgi:integrase